MKRLPLLTSLSHTLRRMPIIMQMPYLLHKRLQPRYSVGVNGIVFNDAREVLLVEHVFHPTRPWGLPGGWTDRSEDPADAVERELCEELGLVVEAHTVVLAKCTQPNHLDIAFLCRANNDIGALSFELLAYGWYHTEALPPMFDFQYKAIAKAVQIASR